MEQGLPDVSSAIAEEGTLLHAVYAGASSYEDLTPDQQVVIDKAREIEAELIQDCLRGREYEAHAEERLWYCGEPVTEEYTVDSILLKSGDPLPEDSDNLSLDDITTVSVAKTRTYRPEIFSGQFDKLFITKDRKYALLIDLKCGYIPVDNVADNIQLRAYALLIQQNLGIDNVFVGVIQPRTKTPKDICHYASHDLERAKYEILHVIDAAYDLSAKRIPSEQACKYCKAKTICKEAQGQVASLVPPQTIDLDKRVAQMPAQDLARFLDIAENADEVIAAVRTEAKRRITEGLDVPGWRLKPGNTIREVEPLDAFQVMKSAGVTASEFMGMCKVTIGKLEIAYGAKHGLKGKSLKDSFNDAMGPYLTTKQNAPSLARD